MRFTIVAIATLAACTVAVEDRRIDSARAGLADVCGAAPSPPAVSAVGTLGTTTRVWVDVVYWEALHAHLDAVEAWSACIEGR